MPQTREQLQRELERRYRMALDQITTEKGLDFETLQRISDYVALIESTPILFVYVEADRVRWAEKQREVESLNLGILGRLRRRLHMNLQTDFYFSHSYQKFLHVYHSINYLKGIEPPSDFDWGKGFKKAISDMEDIQIGIASADAPLPFRIRNSFLLRKSEYRKLLDDVHSALALKLSKPEQKKGLQYDLDKSILTIGDKIVQIKLRNQAPDAHYVLDYLSEHDFTEPAYFSEILEKKFRGERKSWRSMRRACQDIQNKVKKQAEIDDFLKMTSGKSGYVAINPLYA